MRKMLAGAALAGAVAIFSFAFSGSLHCDPQEIGDGFAPAKGGQAPRAGSSSQAGQASGAKTPETKKAAAASGSEFRAEDGLFTCRIPGGWKVRPANIGGTTVQVLEPEKGGDERILVTAVPSTVSSLQELTQQAIALVTQQLLPGSRVAEMPKFTQQGDMQVAEIRYVVMTGAGQATWWHGLMLKDRIALLACLEAPGRTGRKPSSSNAAMCFTACARGRSRQIPRLRRRSSANGPTTAAAV